MIHSHVIGINLQQTVNEGSLIIPAGVIKDLAGNTLMDESKTSFSYSPYFWNCNNCIGYSDQVKLDPVRSETSKSPVHFRLIIPEPQYTISNNTINSEETAYQVICYSLTNERQVLDYQLSKGLDQVLTVSAYPKEPCYVLCSVELYVNAVSKGFVTNIARYVSMSIETDIQYSYLTDHSFSPPDNSVYHSLLERKVSLSIQFNQVITSCYKEMFEISGLYIRSMEYNMNSPFSSSCILTIDTDSPGYKVVKMNQYVVESKAGATNQDDIEFTIVYEKSRPIVNLYDITTFNPSFNSKRHLIILFSRVITDLPVLLFHSVFIPRFQILFVNKVLC